MNKLTTILMLILFHSSIWAQFTDYGTYFKTSDSIGIGARPKAKFHVNGGTKLGSSYFGTVPGSLANSWIRDTWMTASTSLEWDSSSNVWRRGKGTYNEFGGIIWEDNATYFIRGNRGDKLEFTNEEFLENSFLMVSVNKNFIGIGTNYPDARLSVNGTVHANEVKVDTKNWSDFVFENKYSLDSLEVVEAFIRDNGHLKSIPSAEEVEKNGILLGEMDAKLLQKIEELTLYLIQQNKEMKALKERIKTLENNN